MIDYKYLSIYKNVKINVITNSYLHIIGAVLCILLIWLLLLGALCCRCGTYETKIRYTLLWYVYIYIYIIQFACLHSILKL